ncbi:hypothetical protein BDV3_003377 [Batrachochytrium dendrobatidis]
MELDDNMKELIQHLEDLKLLTTDAQLYKADEIWDRLLVLLLELKEQDYSYTDVAPRLQSIELQDIITKYLEYNRPSLQIKVMEFTTVFAIMVQNDGDKNMYRVLYYIDDENFGIVNSQYAQECRSSSG